MCGQLGILKSLPTPVHLPADQPGLLNTAGYYDALLQFMAHSVREGFLSEAQNAVVQVDTDPVALLDALAAAAQRSGAPDDYSKV